MSGHAEGWFRPLNDGRTEIFLKGQGLKLRCSGDQDTMNELADFFEEKTGLSVNGPDSDVFTRVRKGPAPIEGQLDLLDASNISSFLDETTPTEVSQFGVSD